MSDTAASDRRASATCRRDRRTHRTTWSSSTARVAAASCRTDRRKLVARIVIVDRDRYRRSLTCTSRRERSVAVIAPVGGSSSWPTTGSIASTVRSTISVHVHGDDHGTIASTSHVNVDLATAMRGRRRRHAVADRQPRDRRTRAIGPALTGAEARVTETPRSPGRVRARRTSSAAPTARCASRSPTDGERGGASSRRGCIGPASCATRCSRWATCSAAICVARRTIAPTTSQYLIARGKGVIEAGVGRAEGVPRAPVQRRGEAGRAARSGAQRRRRCACGSRCCRATSRPTRSSCCAGRSRSSMPITAGDAAARVRHDVRRISTRGARRDRADPQLSPDHARVRAGATAGPATTRPVPLRWLRAFGQMQAASLLAADRFELSPIDLYNVLLALRCAKAQHARRAACATSSCPASRRASCSSRGTSSSTAPAAPYRGTRAARDPHVGPQSARTCSRASCRTRSRSTVAIAGPGLPALYVVDLGDATLSLALSGWTDAGWAGISTFDLLAADDDPARDRRARRRARDAARPTPRSPTTLGQSARRGPPHACSPRSRSCASVTISRPASCSRGRCSRRRSPPAALKFRDAREAAAHRLLAEPGAVTLTKVARSAAPRAARSRARSSTRRRTARSIRRSRSIARAARRRRSCTCSAFRRAGIKEGPCEHMIALRVQLAREQARLEAARETPEGRALITAETRTLMRRTAARRRDLSALARRPHRHRALRHRRARCACSSCGSTTVDDARGAYFARLDDLATKGYLDATQDVTVARWDAQPIDSVSEEESRSVSLRFGARAASRRPGTITWPFSTR